jgi:hypothetical protein
MKTMTIKIAVALALLGALGTAAVTLTGASAVSAAEGCIPQYDTSGAQTAPYC